jgi:hypothetical protein
VVRRCRPFIANVKAQMPFSKKLVLHCPNGMPAGMAELAAQFVADGVRFVAAVGPACREIEDMVDDASVAAGSPEQNFILTSSHPDESVDDAIEFAEGLTGEYDGPVQLVELAQ